MAQDNCAVTARQSLLSMIALEDCELSVRTIGCFQRAGWYKTLADVDSESDDNLLRIPHFGRKSLKEIREVITSTMMRANTFALPRDMLQWVREHQSLVYALMAGEAVIVPSDKTERAA